MKPIQPYPHHESGITVPPDRRAPCSVPVFHVRYRYPHHSSHSGYDRLCDYCGKTIRLPHSTYWLGETLWRLPALVAAKYGGQHEYSRYDWVMERAVMRHFREHTGAVYHFIYGEKSFRQTGRLAGRNGNRIVVTVHHPEEHHAELFRSLDRYRRVDRVVTVSRVQLSAWANVVGADRVSYVPYAVDTDFFTPPADPKPPPPLRCLFVGFHARDFDALDRLVGELREPDFHWTLICGNRRCEPLARAYDHVTWQQRVDEPEYLRLLQQSHALVLPLLRSTTNTAVLEAMACGLPVVTNAGGIEDYLDPDSSLVYSAGDTEGMAAGLRQLQGDAGAWKAMSQAARRRALTFSWEATARRMTALYEEVASR